MEFKRLGAGLYAQVYAHGNFPVVLKKTYMGDPWFRYANWVLSRRGRKTPGQQFMPEIFSVHQDSNDRDANVLAVMKRYDTTVSKLLRNSGVLNKFETMNFMEKHFDLTPAQKDNWQETAGELYDAFSCFHACMSHREAARKFSMRHFNGYRPKKSIKDLVCFLRYLAKSSMKTSFFPNDVHCGNLMVDDQYNLVLTDPAS